ncbi:efflux RND transporter periplasmic adaptor subunit [Halioxenophilus aromaticivorans]|uniref:Efflux RND transporter periplasmic adaptor subunit n=1 Tax=Halioxenophilus aromaticivorans TaxID=1306992 RepID=A0AAV3U0X4_9ALTE
MRRLFTATVLLAVGLGAGYFAAQLQPGNHNGDTPTSVKPLYWTAPMDPDYRRDAPGKSPMGMDLIPVYDEAAETEQPGTVAISPTVVNNLGVRTAEVGLKALNPSIKTVGIVQYDEQQLEHLHPRVAGWIEQLFVQSTGDTVEQGQPLFSLYSPDLVYAQEDLLQAVNQENARLVKAAEARMRALKIPESLIRQVRSQRKVQQRVTFYAPKSGVLDNLNVREGFYVEPGLQLMSIATLDTVWVEAEIFAQQSQRVQVGLPVTMTLDYTSAREWAGSVDYIYPQLDQQNRSVRLRLRFTNPDATLKPGMYARVTIAQNQAPVLAVAKEAIIRTGNQNRAVLQLSPGQFKSVAVTLGASDQYYFEILDGLAAGDTVVTSAQFLLDSESSKSSDFLRMASTQARKATEKAVQSAAVMGQVNDVNPADKTVNISRGPIEKWNRPPATMDFTVADNIDFDLLMPGSNVHFVFEIRAGDFVITQVHPMAKMVEPTTQHEGHQHD